MATTRQQIDSRGRSLLQLLTDKESAMANLMNPSSNNQGTYNGPVAGKPVNISWPKPDVNSTVGSEVGDNEKYFLREFNLDGIASRTIGSGSGGGYGDGVLTEEQHNSNPFGSAATPVWRNTQGKQHNQPFVGGKSGYATDRPAFMEKSKRKSLATLYWEMRGAFVDSQNRGYFAAQGQDGQDKTYTNRYSDTDADSYVEQFHNQTAEFYFPPADQNSLMIAAQAGFNLGQPLQQNYSVIQSLKDKGARITRDWLETLGNSPTDELLKQFFIQIMGDLNPTTRVSQLYRPGWSRPAQPILEKIPFVELLQQNLLLPPEGSGILPIGANNPNTNAVDLVGTHQALYTQNRATGTDRSGQAFDAFRYSRGQIAGTGINALQEPLENDETGEVPMDENGKTNVPFTFKDDDDVYLTHSKKHAGFTTNATNISQQPNALPNAITDIKRTGGRPADLPEGYDGTYRANAVDVITAGEDQYFPFTFSTVNKKGNRIQICTLQASIQSLGEQYTPTWQSKHFFGRSEQIHTYTFTDRTIDISFVIHADSMRLLQNVYSRVLWLAQQTYPDYSSENRIGSGPIIAMRVGDLFQYKAGFIRSLSYDWNFLGPGGKWELTSGVRMPQACNVTMSYQVIHEKVPDRDYNFYGGPGGGLSEGFKTQRRVQYNPNAVAWDQSDNSSLDRSERFIPTQDNVTRLGEENYLDEVDRKNSPPFLNSANQYNTEEIG